MPEYLTPGVYFEFQDTAPPVIRRVRSDIAGFVGLAERGLLDRAVQIDSWREFQAKLATLCLIAIWHTLSKAFLKMAGELVLLFGLLGKRQLKHLLF
jgi:phage tail sheath protein FI